MAKIVNVVVVDLTRPVEQKGFKSVALIDCTKQKEASTISDVKGLDGQLATVASSYFGNGGGYLVVAGVDCSASDDGKELKALLEKTLVSNPFYGLTLIMPVAKQKVLLKVAKEFCEGNELLCVTELLGEKDTIKTDTQDLNSDRVAVFASKAESENYTGLGSGVCGMGFPQDEGSLTWANKVITGVPLSKYTLAEELELQENNVNYLTNVLGFNITQFGRTLSGSNIDITRSKDYLKNRIAETLTSTLVNSKKIPFTSRGLAQISSALDTVGIQAINQGMLETYQAVLPNIDEIPATDKANRVLKNVKFIAQLSGAIETIDLELQIVL